MKIYPIIKVDGFVSIKPTAPFETGVFKVKRIIELDTIPHSEYGYPIIFSHIVVLDGVAKMKSNIKNPVKLEYFERCNELGIDWTTETGINESSLDIF